MLYQNADACTRLRLSVALVDDAVGEHALLCRFARWVLTRLGTYAAAAGISEIRPLACARWVKTTAHTIVEESLSSSLRIAPFLFRSTPPVSRP
jgi:hypothetical protein